MKNILIFLLLLFNFIILSPSFNYAQTQTSSLTNVTRKLAAYMDIHATEKAYLQFDKPYYAVGDTIYFKAYIVLGAEHKLSALSGVLNAELIEPDNRISRSIKLQSNAGTASGDFVLSDTLKGGTYRIRAYTNWMRNAGENTFFEQTIAVAANAIKPIPENGPPQKYTQHATRGNNKIDLQFLPEGGTLVAGNYSKIAFKAISPDGFGTDVKGVITDNAGNEITAFASSHLGMGSFTMVPQAGRSYTAVLIGPDSSTSKISLPQASINGYTINVNNTDADTLRIRITASPEAAKEKLGVICQSGGVVYYKAEKQSENRFFTALVPKIKLPEGIVQFTLFNQNGEPINERLVFINKNDELALTVSTQKQSFAPRQKVKMELAAKSKGNKPATGSLSVAITNETTVPVDTANENTILTSLLLTSELQGGIEQPGYYFSNRNAQTDADLDNLMLTQGYRHFSWKEVLGDTPPPVNQPEKGLRISGTVKKNGKPAPGAKVSLFSKAGGAFTLDTLTDNNGRFSFNDLVFIDSTKFVVQSKVPKGQDAVTLELDTAQQAVIRGNSTVVKSFERTDLSAYTANQKQFYIEQEKFGINRHAVALREVRVEAKKEKPIPHSENLNGPGNADQVFTAADLDKLICNRIVDCLEGRITGMKFDKDGVPWNLRGGRMSIVIDGNFVELDDFINLHTEDIEGIEVLISTHSSAIYGARMANGGLIITTKRARKLNEYYRYAPGVVTYMPKGFYKVREFYSPQYDNPHTNQKMTDLRSTIYWNPNIITDKDGKASFEYFNADGKGTYRVVVEGIDADGNLGRQVFRYKVE